MRPIDDNCPLGSIFRPKRLRNAQTPETLHPPPTTCINNFRQHFRLLMKRVIDSPACRARGPPTAVRVRYNSSVASSDEKHGFPHGLKQFQNCIRLLQFPGAKVLGYRVCISSQSLYGFGTNFPAILARSTRTSWCHSRAEPLLVKVASPEFTRVHHGQLDVSVGLLES